MQQRIDGIIGPMFANKTTTLQQLFRESYIRNPEGTICFIPLKDTRYTELPLNASHDGRYISAVRVAHLKTDPPELTDNTIRNIFVDEAHFLEGFADFALRQRALGRSVVFAALSSDYLKRPWKEIHQLVPAHATCIFKKAVCVVCKGEAEYTRKLEPDNGPLEEVGGDEKYVAACFQHWGCDVPVTDAMLRERARVIENLKAST